MKKLVAVALSALLVCGAVTAVAATTATPTIVVSVDSSIEVDPDYAVASFGVTTSETTATKAREVNTKSMNAVIAAVKKLGIKQDKIQTEYVSMNPSYDYSGATSTVQGYQVSNTISVTIDDLTKVADVVNAAMKAGANTLNGVTFNLRDRDTYYNQALAQAVKKAPQKAKTIAAASGMTLGSVESIVEGYSYSGVSSLSGAKSYGLTTVSASDNIGDTIQAGTIEVQASVTVTYNAK